MRRTLHQSLTILTVLGLSLSSDAAWAKGRQVHSGAVLNGASTLKKSGVKLPPSAGNATTNGGNKIIGDPVKPIFPPMRPSKPTLPPKGVGQCHKWHGHVCGPWMDFGFGFTGSMYYDGCSDQVAAPQSDEDTASEPQASAEAPQDGLTKVPNGASITLRGENLGKQKGRVAMQIGNLLLAVKVVDWDAESVTLTLPQLELAGSSDAKFLITRADGTLASKIGFELVAAASAVAAK